MPKVVARLVSQWRSAAFALHGEWQEAVDNDEPAPELAGPIGEVLTRHLHELGTLRRSQFGGALLAAAEKDAMAALRAQPGKTGLKGDWVLEDESARWFLAELTAALDRRLAARPLAEVHRSRLRTALRDEGDRIVAGVDDEPEFAGIVDNQVRQMIAGRLDSRVERTALRPEEFDGVSRELVQTLGFVCFLELLVFAHPDLLDSWRREGTVDPRAIQAWVDLDGSAAVPPAAAQRPGINTTARGPHCGRDGLKQARGVLSPHGGREQSRLSERLIKLHRAQGPKTVAHVVVREELWREGFPFALSNPRLRQAATLAWLLLDARQRPTALRTQLASVRRSMPVGSDRQARVMVRRTLREFDGTGGSSLWDAAVVGAAIQRDSRLAPGADGWNDAIAAEIFGDTRMSPFLRRTVRPGDVLDPAKPTRADGSVAWLMPAGVVIRKQLLNLDNGGRPFDPGHGSWLTIADQSDQTADLVFDWVTGLLRRLEQEVEPGTDLPGQDITDPDGRWSAAEVNRRLSWRTLASKIVNVRKAARKENPVDDISPGPTAADDQADPVPTRSLSRSDLERIRRTFQEPVALWIGELLRRQKVPDSARWGDLGELTRWMDLSVDTRETMDLLAGWLEAHPGAGPPVTAPSTLPPDRAAAVPLPLQPDKALEHLTDLLPWRAAHEFLDPSVTIRWKKPSEPDTLRKSARAYYQFQGFDISKKTEDRWSLDVRRLRDLLWLYRHLDSTFA